MPWRLFSRSSTTKYKSLDNKKFAEADPKKTVYREAPPVYVLEPKYATSPELAFAAKNSLLDALNEFCSECPEMSRNALNGNWGVKATAKIRKIELNLRTLKLIPPNGRIAWTRVDWYAELVVRWKADFRSPFLIQQLLVN